MADPQIKFKRSSVASKRPSLGILTTGEFAINTYDGSLFTVRDTGGVGIATTVTNLTPWTENYGGESITYSGNQTSGVATITTSGDAIFAGVVTATEFHGDGSNLTGISAGSTANVVTDSLKVIGLSTFSGDLKLDDDVKLIVGVGSDLQIYHDGDHSYISDEGEGDLKLRSNNFRFSNVDESKISIAASATGAVELYYDNEKKFETTGYGITVTDTIGSPQLNVSGIATIGFATVGVATVGILTVNTQFYPPSLTSEDRDIIGIKSDGNLSGFSTGAFIFNSTVEKLQIAIGNTWASLTMDIDPYSIINM